MRSWSSSCDISFHFNFFSFCILWTLSDGILSEACSGGCEEEDEEEEFDWQIEQEIYTETPAETLKEYHKYGFGNLRSGVFTRLQVRTFVPDDTVDTVFFKAFDKENISHIKK